MRLKLCLFGFMLLLCICSFYFPGRSGFQAMSVHASEVDSGSGSDTAADADSSLNPAEAEGEALADQLAKITKLLKIGLFVIIAILIINVLFGGATV